MLFVGGLVAVWQLFASLNLCNQLLVPSPAQIGVALVELLKTDRLILDVVASVQRVLVGFAIATGLGIGLAIMFVLVRPIAGYIGFLVELLRPVPPIAWIPIAVLWFGIGNTPAFFIVSLGAFFPIFVNCFAGIQHVDAKFLMIARSYNASRKQILAQIYFPLVLPYLVTGMRIGLGVGWMSVITAELVGAQNGLGYMMQLNRVLLQTQNVMVGMVIVGLLGYAMNRMMLMIERAVAPWRRSANNM